MSPVHNEDVFNYKERNSTFVTQ